MPFTFTPPTGLLDTSTYPTNPANETAARQQFMDLFYQLRDALNLSNPYVIDTGAANAYIVTLTPAPTTYTSGMVVNFKVANANTGASTINVNGIGLKTIKKDVNVDLATGDLLAGQIVTCIYDGTYFQLLNPDYSTKANVNYENPIAPTLLNSWVNNGGVYATVKYWKDSLGYVNGMGVVKSGTIGQAAYTLPVGYRPAASIQPVGSSNSGAGVIIIDSSGNVVPAAGSNTSFDLTFRFRAGV